MKEDNSNDYYVSDPRNQFPWTESIQFAIFRELQNESP